MPPAPNSSPSSICFQAPFALPRSAGAHSEDGQEVAEQLLSFAGADRFRMKLDAFDRKLAMAQPHDFAYGCTRADRQALRQTLGFNQQRMVAHRLKGVREPCEDCFVIMYYRGGFSVHQSRGAHNPSAKGRSD